MIGSGVAAVAVGLVLLTLALALAGQRESNRRVRSAELVLRTASDAERAVIDIETGLRGYVITGERRFLEPYRTGAAVAPARAARLAKLTARRITQGPRARLLQQQIDDYVGVYARPLVALAARAPARARSAALTDEGKRRVDAIRTGFAALGALEADRLRRATNGADSDAQRAIAVGVGGLLALLAVVVALGWYVARRLAHPLRDMAGAAGRLAVGDLSVRVPEGGVGELDRLAHAFNAMAASLDEAQAALRRRAAELETAGERTEALFDTVFARAPVGLAVLDPRMRFVRVNQTLAAMDGVPEDEHLGHGIGEVLPDMAGEIGARLRDVVADKRTIADAEVEGATRAAPAEQRIWRASYFPIVTEGGETLGTGAIFVDITEHRLAARERRRLLQGERRAAQRTARLQQVTARLSRAVGSHDVAQVVVEQGIAALGAGAGVVVVAAPRSSELELAAIAGYDDAEALDWRKLSVAGRTPLADAVRTGQAVSLPDRATLRERYPGRREVLERSGHRAWIAAPIAAAGDVRGGALFAFGAEGRLGDDEARLLELLLAQAGAALDRAALFERQRHIASTLQRSLLPARLPEIPGVELAAVYRPAGDGNEVGGDFYDVVPTARELGRRDRRRAGQGTGGGGADRPRAPHAARGDHAPLRPTRRSSWRGSTASSTSTTPTASARSRWRRSSRAPTGSASASRAAGTCRRSSRGARTRRSRSRAAARCSGSRRTCGSRPSASSSASATGSSSYTDGVLDARAPSATLTATHLVELLAEAGAGSPQQVADVLHDAAVGATQAPRDDIAIIALRVSDRPPAADPAGGASPAIGAAAPI